jgi:hypothetical protein
MDFVTMLTPLLGMAFLIERIIEVAFNVLDWLLDRVPVPWLSAKKKSTVPADQEQFTGLKVGATFIASIILGIYFTTSWGIAFFNLPNGSGGTVSNSMNQLFSGVVAGAVAPYAHQVLEGLLNLQKFLEEQKKKLAGQ